MWVRAVVFVVALTLASPDARAADLLVWWDKGYYPAEDRAVAELITAFEAKTSKQVELVQHPQWEMRPKLETALAAGQVPDFMFGMVAELLSSELAEEGRLVDLKPALGDLTTLFDADLLKASMRIDRRTGKRAVYALPMGRSTNHVHVWKSLLEQAGFTLADIPREWESFWAFWCDKVQPAVRKATGRDDIYGTALTMSLGAPDTATEFDQFLWAYTPPDWPPPGEWTLVDMPGAPSVFVKALASYTATYKKGCTPPASVTWEDGTGNNRAFLDQTVVMTLNQSLSIPNTLRVEQAEDYRENVMTIEWPRNVFGMPLILAAVGPRGVVFKGGRSTALAEEFVRFLIADGWLAHWLTHAGDRYLPPMHRLIDQPFWMNAKDSHRFRSVVQALAQPHAVGWWGIPFDRVGRFGAAEQNIYATAVHRVVAEGVSPEQAADEAIARTKQILSE